MYITRIYLFIYLVSAFLCPKTGGIYKQRCEEIPFAFLDFRFLNSLYGAGTYKFQTLEGADTKSVFQ